MAKKKKKKKKLNIKRVIIVLILAFLFFFSIYKLLSQNITNIYITGNEYFTDQQIIDMAGITNYPNSIKNMSYTIKKRLEKNKFILSVNVYKKNFLGEVHISIKENYPLFYYQSKNYTILFNGLEVDELFSVPRLINEIPNTIYDEFLDCLKNIDKDIINRMSEIQYKPNEVDYERFLIFMNDGNYVYITLNKFMAINKYFEMIKSIDNKKGVFYLDSGEYFDVFD